MSDQIRDATAKERHGSGNPIPDASPQEWPARRPRIQFLVILAVSVFISILINNIMFVFHLKYLGTQAISDDGWLGYAETFRYAFFHPGFNIAGYMQSDILGHLLTPLYPFLLAVVDIPINNMVVSIIILNCTSFAGSVFVFKKILDITGKLQDHEKYLILILYASNVTMIIIFWSGRIWADFMILITMIAFRANLMFIRNPSLGNANKVMLVNTIALFTREEMWILVLFSLMYFTMRFLHEWMTKRGPLKSSSFILVLYSFFITVFIPCLLYVLYIFSFNLIGLIFYRTNDLGLFTNWSAFIEFSIDVPVSFNILLVFLVIDRHRVFADPVNRPFLLWIALYVVELAIGPGIYWVIYWSPITFSVVFLAHRSFASDPFKRGTHLKTLVILYIVINLLASVEQTIEVFLGVYTVRLGIH